MLRLRFDRLAHWFDTWGKDGKSELHMALIVENTGWESKRGTLHRKEEKRIATGIWWRNLGTPARVVERRKTEGPPKRAPCLYPYSLASGLVTHTSPTTDAFRQPPTNDLSSVVAVLGLRPSDLPASWG